MGGAPKIIAAAGLLLFAGTLLAVSSDNADSPSIRRKLAASYIDSGAVKKYKLPELAKEWCESSVFNPLNYHACNPDDIVHKIPFMAGLTNGLKMVLLTVIATFEENRCFFLTEENNHLLFRDDKSQELQTFIGRYFEPIGLAKDDPIVLRAEAEGRVKTTSWIDYWENEDKRRMHGRLNNITSLGYVNIESTILKKVMLRQMWRLLPNVRGDSCSTLESHGLEQDYLAFSVRRGDKDTEGFEFTKPEDYIAAAEQARDNHFGGKIPKIFVATDDCAVMGELRALRPSWEFTSECDRSQQHSHGFVLSEMRTWTLEQTDEHYRKFFVELIGLAGAKFYIGVAYTNVAWWSAYMRPYRWSHQYLDKPKQHVYDTLNLW